MKTKTIYNGFYNVLKTLETNRTVKSVTKTGIDPITEYPAIEISLGADVRQETDKGIYEHELTLYSDIHVTSLNKNIDELMLDLRDTVESKVFEIPNLGLSDVFIIKFISQSEPNYNQASTEFASSTRLEWSINFFNNRETL